MRKIISLLLVSAILLGIAGCGQPALAEVIQSDKQRNTSPAVDETDLTVLVDGNNAFAFDLYQAEPIYSTHHTAYQRLWR